MRAVYKTYSDKDFRVLELVSKIVPKLYGSFRRPLIYLANGLI